MVAAQNLSIYAIKVSSVVPARATVDNKIHELTTMDLALKLHYINGIYFFKPESTKNLSILDLKKAMYPLLELYYPVSGRIRRMSENGVPFIQCNDGGVRIVEACCDKSIDEWLVMALNDSSVNDSLISSHVLGPDLGFSPLIYIQFTWFTCGGISLGISWAHVLGDPFSAARFINSWAHFMESDKPLQALHVVNGANSTSLPSLSENSSFTKRFDSVSDRWAPKNNPKMEAHLLQISSTKVEQLLTNFGYQNNVIKLSKFHILSAMIWKSLCGVDEDQGPQIVTICTTNRHCRENEVPNNGLVYSIVEPDFSILKSNVSDLAVAIANNINRENMEFMEGMEYVVYGGNLTFVDLEQVELYGFELKGHKPIFANYTINGVGEGGAVMVLPGPIENGRGGGTTVNVMLPGNQMAKLKSVLQKEWDL